MFFWGPVLYHSDRFLSRGLHRTTEALEIPMAWVTVAVPLAVVIIFIHILAKIISQQGLLNWQNEVSAAEKDHE